jgi:hypothetical protein
MFEWLERELSLIKTPHFHLVDGPADKRLREAVNASSIRLPSSYQEFVLNFGNAKLYRDSSNNSYRIGVFCAPRMAVLEDGTHIYHIGFHDGASVYVKESSDLKDGPIFEFEEDSEEIVADSFEEWLTASCANIRDAYTRDQWEEIVRGPRPFTAEEAEIIKARGSIHWALLGIDGERNHVFEVMNQSSRRLSSLTIGVRSKDGRLNGAIHLDIAHIRPGQKDIVRANCYKNLISPQEIEIFGLPDPKPEDRDYYWEFGTD